MLQDIRDRAHGWIAWLIVFLISIPFALWGVQSYLGGSVNTDIATIDGRSVTKNDFRQALERVRAQFRQIPDNMAKQFALQELISQRLVLSATQRQNYRVSDEEVLKRLSREKAFQKAGAFDKATYKQVLQSIGLEGPQWEAQVRQSALLSQFNDGYTKTAFVTKAELDDYLKLDQQTRDFDYLLVAAEVFKADIKPMDAALEAYYNANTNAYLQQAQVKLEYVALDRREVMKGIDASEAQLQTLFEVEADQLTREEQRETRHIFVAVNDAQDAAELSTARAKAEAILQRIQAGENFEDLARALSEDPSAKEGGFIGSLIATDDTQDPAFLAAVFTLEKNGVSEVVQSAFGFHLIKVTDIQDSVPTFEGSRDQLLRLHQQREATKAYVDLYESLGRVAYDESQSVQPAAEEIGFPVKETDWLTASGGADEITSAAAVLDIAFSPDMTERQQNSPVIDVTADLAVIIRVVDYQPAAPKPFADVKALIAEKLVQKQASEQANELAVTLKQQLDTGKPLSAVATENALTLETVADIDRKSLAVPAAVRDHAFKAAKGEVMFAVLPQGDYALIVLKEINTHERPDEAIVDFHASSLGDELGQSELGTVMKNIQQHTQMQIFNSNM